jgi:flagellar hook capping protein FlgD/beta-propeller repeat-containing protein
VYKTYCHILLFLLVYNTIYAHNNVMQDWVRHDAGPDSVQYESYIAIDIFDNIYIAVCSLNLDSSRVELELIKYDTEGEVKWIRQYFTPGAESDCPESITTDLQGNVIIAAASDKLNTNYDYLTIKYDSSGNRLWESFYNSPDSAWDEPEEVVTDSLGNIYVTGTSDDDILTIKYDFNGNEIWVRRYDNITGSPEEARAITIDKNGCVYVTGFSDTSTASCLTIKYNSLGNLVWNKEFHYDPEYDNYGQDIALDNYGNVYIAGSIDKATNNDFLTLKYNSSGELQWFKEYDGTASFEDYADNIVVDKNGDIYVGGQSDGIGTSGDYTIVKYDSTGNQLWVARYDSTNFANEVTGTMLLDDEGNIYFMGQSNGGSTNWDLLTVKYNKNGELVWDIRYNGDLNTSDFMQRRQTMVIDSQGNIYITGISWDELHWMIVTVVKYKQNVSAITQEQNYYPKSPVLFQNHPNPFNNKTQIKFYLPEVSDVEIEIINILGQSVKTLLSNKKIHTGYHTVSWDGKDQNNNQVSSGVYLCRISTPNYCESKKLLLIK